jgi:hypothetical protein
MKLTSSTFFSIQVNGVPSNPFSPSCGIRQGYPLFPFLFVIMAKGLSQYTKSSIADGSLKVLSLHGINPHISHNQFIDDTMMMGVPTVWEAHHILSILNDFNEASDTTINIDKSHILFFKHSSGHSIPYHPHSWLHPELPSVQIHWYPTH